jgi:putative transposase
MIKFGAMRRAYKFRLWTNANQERELEIMLETHRRLYNSALAQRKESWEERQESVSVYDQKKILTAARKEDEWLARVNAGSAQMTLFRLDQSFQNFFRRVKAGEQPGYPRFKARDRFDSFEYGSHGDGARLKGSRLRVQHVGMIRVCLHREVEGEIKTLSIKREADKWFVIAIAEQLDPPKLGNINPVVGIDLGLEYFLSTSDGQHVENPRYLKDGLPALHRAGRAVSRKKKSGHNRRKAVKALRRKHARVANLRREHAHKAANNLIGRYGKIAVERLAIRGMVRNRRLAQAISDVGWGQFIATLKSKAARAGVEIKEVDPRRTSQECSGCGALVQKALSVRVHRCECGLVLQKRRERCAQHFAQSVCRAWNGLVERNRVSGCGAPRSCRALADRVFTLLPRLAEIRRLYPQRKARDGSSRQ